MGVGLDNRFGNVVCELDARTAAKRNQDGIRIALLIIPLEPGTTVQRWIEHCVFRTGQRQAVSRAGVLRDAAVDDEIGVETADAKVMDADDETADTPRRADPAARIGRDPAERRALSERIAAGREALFERDEPVRAFESFLDSLRA